MKKGYFQLARNVSRYSGMHPRLGAVIAKKKPVAVGFNVQKTHTDFDTYSIHAEQKAVLNAGNIDLRGASIYVYRETKGGHPALSFPCEHCYELLKSRGIRKVYFTTSSYPYWNMVIIN